MRALRIPARAVLAAALAGGAMLELHVGDGTARPVETLIDQPLAAAQS